MVSRVAGPGLVVPAGGAGGATNGPATADARRGGRGSPRNCPNTRPRRAGVLLTGDASRCETGLVGM